MTGSTQLTDLKRRFHIRRFGNEGLVFDTESSQIFAANSSAALLIEALLRESSLSAARDAVFRQLNLSPSRAEHELATVLQSLTDARSNIRPKGIGDFFFDETPDQVVLTLDGVPVLSASKQGLVVAWLAGPLERSPCSAYRALLALAPKLLSLKGHFVVHASAVLVHDKAQVIAGESGAGKTTLARGFGGAGASVLSEDFCVLQSRGSRTCILERAEQLTRDWAREACAVLNSRDTARLTFPGTVGAQARGVDEIWFISAARRSARTDFSRWQLSNLQACIETIPHIFLGTADTLMLKRTFDEACLLAQTAVGFEVGVPMGIANLGEAIIRHIDTIVS